VLSPVGVRNASSRRSAISALVGSRAGSSATCVARFVMVSYGRVHVAFRGRSARFPRVARPDEARGTSVVPPRGGRESPQGRVRTQWRHVPGVFPRHGACVALNGMGNGKENQEAVDQASVMDKRGARRPRRGPAYGPILRFQGRPLAWSSPCTPAGMRRPHHGRRFGRDLLRRQSRCDADAGAPNVQTDAPALQPLTCAPYVVCTSALCRPTSGGERNRAAYLSSFGASGGGSAMRGE
jgi:hypothetical protein